MGMTIALEDEKGVRLEVIQDPTNLLHSVLPDPEDANYQVAGTIDWYGDTTFNYLQATKLRGEWQRLMKASASAETTALLRRIDDLLTRCSENRHVYVKFYGDRTLLIPEPCLSLLAHGKRMKEMTRHHGTRGTAVHA